jgi:hypothetical protein
MKPDAKVNVIGATLLSFVLSRNDGLEGLARPVR